MLEIEHKFLVADDSWRQFASRSVHVVQGYFTHGGGEYSLRVRIVEDREAKLSIKSQGTGLSRSEYEYPIPLEDARAMFREFCGTRIIDKRRFYIEAAPFLWEIDEFGGANAGLVLAEIEIPSEDAEFVKPSWLGREVTGDIRYLNETLAFRPWSASQA
ncbi:MAG: CYTH domain-containing protein [Victivallales bacterium]|nr:CYTH domain-containing protein [Victivallales bacterium]